jgi:GxxExxY protein
MSEGEQLFAMQDDNRGMRVDDPLTGRVIAACIEVHRQLGPGLLESVYELCLCHELALRGLAFTRQLSVPINYKGLLVEGSHRIDLVVEHRVVVEAKAVEALLPLHEAQLKTYLKITTYDVGLLVNFNVPLLRQGLRRLVKSNQRISPSELPNSPLP